MPLNIIDKLLSRINLALCWLCLRSKRFHNQRLGFDSVPPFFDSGPASDIAYRNVRDIHRVSDIKEQIERLWLLYAPYADRHFRADAKAHFHQRTWEMYVGAVLRMHGFELNKISDDGPEFFIEVYGKKVWLEAVAPGPGDPQRPDSVPPLSFGAPIAQYVPEEAIILRLTHALRDKLVKYRVAREKGRINAGDSYVLAINGWETTGYRSDGHMPYIIKATLALGALAVLVSRDTAEPTESFYQRRLELQKHNQSSVPTKAFLSTEYEGISGVLYSSTDIANIREPYGSELFYLHNPMAINPIPAGTFRFQSEYQYSLETELLQRCDWRKDVPAKYSL